MALDKVVDSAILDGALTATANAIREKTGKTDKIVWDKTKGFSATVGEAYEAGKKAEYEARWANILQSAYSMQNLFSGAGWNDSTFDPPYGTTITVDNYTDKKVYSLFYMSNIKDLKGICERRNVKIDLSKAERIRQLITDSQITTFPTIDTRGISDFNTFLFNATKLHTTELILRDDGSQKFSSGESFANCVSLVSLKIHGTIGQDGFNVSSSTNLNKESHISIVNAFSTAAEITATLSEAAVDKAFETSEGANDGITSAEWSALIATRPKVTIEYA